MTPKKEPEGPNAITAVTLKGFKPFADDTRIEIRPLTLFAGANSSGKSSAMQPLLLMKQTEEEAYDPGPLQLDGAYLKFTDTRQILSKIARSGATKEFDAGFETARGLSFKNTYTAGPLAGFELARMEVQRGEEKAVLQPGTFSGRSDDLLFLYDFPGSFASLPSELEFRVHEVVRDQGFLQPRAALERSTRETPSWLFFHPGIRAELGAHLRRALHVPGLRGNPERTYPRAAIGDFLPGPFGSYVASLVAGWQEAEDDLERPKKLSLQLRALGLTSGMQARPVDATRIELLVGLQPKNGHPESQFVNIADVGFGVSQVLPVLVALQAAGPGELVHIEQPELHLHPRAQQALAGILADAARRGVRVVAETHSSTLILAVQTLVAQGNLDPSIVKLHWFQRDARGATQVTSADLDEMGRYGDWPEDFAEVEAKVEGGYLKAVEDKAFGKPRKSKRG